MFKRSLKEKLEQIFEMKVTYDAPSEDVHEQDVMYVGIEDAPCKVVDNLQIAKVYGTLTVFSQNEKLPFGFFIKKIAEANKTLTKDLFFHDIDRNAGTLVNLVARRTSFVFLYKGVHDPDQGEITSLEFPEETDE